MLPDLGLNHSERVTGIEPALSAWEFVRLRLIRCLTRGSGCPGVTVRDPRHRGRQSRTRRRQSRGGMGAGGSFGPPALQHGGSVVLEPADQLGGGLVGGYFAGQPDVDLDRGMVIRANVNGVGPAEDHQPDRLSDQQAGQLERAAGAGWPGGIKRAQPPCPALIDADDSSAVARSPDRGGRNQLPQRFQFLPSCRSFIGLALCTGHPPIRGGHLPAAGPLPLPFLPSCRSLVGLAFCTGCPPIRPARHSWFPSLGMASRQAIRALAAAAERLQATTRCRRRPAARTATTFGSAPAPSHSDAAI